MKLCLYEEGDRRKCGRKADFEIPEPKPREPVKPVQPTRPSDVATNEWVGIVDGDCQGNDEKCTGVNYKGTYVVETDPKGEHSLHVTGTMSWAG